MSMLLQRNEKMSSPFLHEFKRQASFFLKEKIKTARLALTDVTPAELLTEEVTNGDLWAADTRSMVVISRAAFEVDDYWRIVDILHKRLMKFERKTWRVSYKSLLVLEHILTHGPLRVVDEFQCDKEVIQEIGTFQFLDDKGFTWGTSVRNLSTRIIKLLEDDQFLKEEREKSRKTTREIQGFGSFSYDSSSNDGSFNDLAYKSLIARHNSNYSNDQPNQEYEFLAWDDNENFTAEENAMQDHPFGYSDYDTKETLVSAI
ncbi:epsin-3-like [Mercurialis annua]|uniref:epsin-3-like n=1 Tax=Mercurialis annua TaxID=3986 RepID=UPI0021605EF3|nr:epsin-3-like [Mercurialis annua]